MIRTNELGSRVQLILWRDGVGREGGANPEETTHRAATNDGGRAAERVTQGRRHKSR